MLSLTILGWMGTKVRRSNPSYMSPLNSPLVLTRLTTRADSIRMLHLSLRSVEKRLSRLRSKDKDEYLQKLGWLVMTWPRTGGS